VDQPVDRTHTLSILVDNEAGVLARVIGLFSGRGYNIESLTVAEVDSEVRLSRITVVTTGTEMVIEQIKNQLGRLVPVHDVRDLTIEGQSVEHELALIRVEGPREMRVESLRLANFLHARLVDSTTHAFVFEMTGSTEEIDAFVELMRPLGLAEVSRTGVVAIGRGRAQVVGVTTSRMMAKAEEEDAAAAAAAEGVGEATTAEGAKDEAGADAAAGEEKK